MNAVTCATIRYISSFKSLPRLSGDNELMPWFSEYEFDTCYTLFQTYVICVYNKGKMPDKSTGQGKQLSKLMLVYCQLGHKEYIQWLDSLKSKVFIPWNLFETVADWKPFYLGLNVEYYCGKPVFLVGSATPGLFLHFDLLMVFKTTDPTIPF